MNAAVFIDNSNVFKSIQNERKDDNAWVSFYDPLALAKKLAGGRDLAFVNFYCTRPPARLLDEDRRHQRLYRNTNAYYAAIEKLPDVNVKYGVLIGTNGAFTEKNLDTQLTTDMVAGAALGAFDVAILVSNDGDYVSAVSGVKRFEKKVETVFFRGHFSMNLRNISDVTRRARKSFFIPLPFSRTEKLEG